MLPETEPGDGSRGGWDAGITCADNPADDGGGDDEIDTGPRAMTDGIGAVDDWIRDGA